MLESGLGEEDGYVGPDGDVGPGRRGLGTKSIDAVVVGAIVFLLCGSARWAREV